MDTRTPLEAPSGASAPRYGFGGYGTAVARPKPRRRLYSLFHVRTLPGGRKRYESASDMAYPLERARHVFQNHLLGPVLYGGPVTELRPINRTATARYRNL